MSVNPFTSSIVDTLYKNFLRVKRREQRKRMPDMRQKQGFNSAKHKIGDTVVLCQQACNKNAPVKRSFVTIRNIAPKGGVTIDCSFEEDDDYVKVDFEKLQFYWNGDLRGNKKGGRWFWLEDSASTTISDENFLSDLLTHKNWARMNKQDLMEIQSILTKYN